MNDPPQAGAGLASNTVDSLLDTHASCAATGRSVARQHQPCDLRSPPGKGPDLRIATISEREVSFTTLSEMGFRLEREMIGESPPTNYEDLSRHRR